MFARRISLTSHSPMGYRISREREASWKGKASAGRSATGNWQPERSTTEHMQGSTHGIESCKTQLTTATTAPQRPTHRTAPVMNAHTMHRAHHGKTPFPTLPRPQHDRVPTTVPCKGTLLTGRSLPLQSCRPAPPCRHHLVDETRKATQSAHEVGSLSLSLSISRGRLLVACSSLSLPRLSTATTAPPRAPQ